MPHDPLEVHAGARLAGAEVLGLREGRGVGDGPGINLEIETIRKLLTRGLQVTVIQVCGEQHFLY